MALRFPMGGQATDPGRDARTARLPGQIDDAQRVMPVESDLGPRTFVYAARPTSAARAARRAASPVHQSAERRSPLSWVSQPMNSANRPARPVSRSRAGPSTADSTSKLCSPASTPGSTTCGATRWASRRD